MRASVVCSAALAAALAAAGASDRISESDARAAVPATRRDPCELLLSAGARELLRSPELERRNIEAPMPGPVCELHSKADYTRSVLLLIGGEKGSSAAREWFEREEGKRESPPRYRKDQTFGLPAYSLVDPAKGHAELVILKGDLVVVIHLDAPGADLERLRPFTKRILENF